MYLEIEFAPLLKVSPVRLAREFTIAFHGDAKSAVLCDDVPNAGFSYITRYKLRNSHHVVKPSGPHVILHVNHHKFKMI